MKCVRGRWKRLHGRGPEYPYVEALIFINDEEAGIVEFLIDTGGGVTVLSWADSTRLELVGRVSRKKCIETLGIAGKERVCSLKGAVKIVLKDAVDPNIKVEAVADEPMLYVPVEKPKVRGREYRMFYARPSILGWNILKHAKIAINYAEKLVQICFD